MYLCINIYKAILKTMKKIIILILMSIPFVCMAQKKDITKYLAGAVPEVNGRVQFDKAYHFSIPQNEAFQKLLDYVQTQIVEGENHLEQARITEYDEKNGVIAASIQETLYITRSAWVTYSTQFFYQLILQVNADSFDISLRNIRYMYDIETGTATHTENVRAEDWITDKEALNKAKTKLLRVPGKYRRATIDRKDEIFLGAAKSVGIVTTKLIEVEE